MYNTKISTPMTKAFRKGSAQGQFVVGNITPWVIPTSPTSTLADGVFSAGDGGQECQNRIFVLPYCSDQTATFLMRVLWWNHGGQSPNPLDRSWVAMPLGEWVCSAANIPGSQTAPVPPGGAASISTNEFLCESVALNANLDGSVRGSLGLDGAAYSFGVGSGVPAGFMLQIAGARAFSFDFQALDPTNPVAMNAYWSYG